MRRSWWLAGAVAVGAWAGCTSKATREDDGERASARTWLDEGLASYYGPGLEGNRTASGEKLDSKALTAAHRELPFGTCVRVVNMENGRSVQVRVNDRGPFVKGRVVDVSLAAAQKLALVDKGLARVRLYRCAQGR